MKVASWVLVVKQLLVELVGVREQLKLGWELKLDCLLQAEV